MFGVGLVGLSAVFREIGNTIGKYEVEHDKESVFTMGFLNMFWGTVGFLIIAFFIRGEFVLAAASLATLIPRLVLEIAQTHVGVRAVAEASRSTYGFLRILTIPVLLSIDLFLGYTITFLEIVGIVLIIISLVLLFTSHGLKTKGAKLVLFTAINGAITTTLFKYNITHFNSVEAEQSLVYITKMAYLFGSAWWLAGENPFNFFRKKIPFEQSAAGGVGRIILSFAFDLAPASIIMTGKRAFTVLSAIISGNTVFAERHLLLKLGAFLLVVIGLILLVI